MFLFIIIFFLFFYIYYDTITVNIAKVILYLLGFSINIELIKKIPKKCIVIPPSHTSNIDGIISILYYYAYLREINVTIIIKENLRVIFGIFGEKFLKFMYIDRTGNRGVVEKITDKLKDIETYALFIAPEGTRSLVQKWHTGFWYIAKTLDIDICLVAFCYKKKCFSDIVIIRPSNLDKDIALLQDISKKYMPLYNNYSLVHKVIKEK